MSVGFGWLSYYVKLVMLEPDDKQLVCAIYIGYAFMTGLKLVD